MPTYTDEQITGALAALGIDTDRIAEDIAKDVHELLTGEETTEGLEARTRSLLLLGTLLAAVETAIGAPCDDEVNRLAGGYTLFAAAQDQPEADVLLRFYTMLANRLDRTAAQLRIDLGDEISAEEAAELARDKGIQTDGEPTGPDEGPIFAVEGAAAYLHARTASYRLLEMDERDDADPADVMMTQAARAGHIKHAASCLVKAAAEAAYDVEGYEQDA